MDTGHVINEDRCLLWFGQVSNCHIFFDHMCVPNCGNAQSTP